MSKQAFPKSLLVARPILMTTNRGIITAALIEKRQVSDFKTFP